MGLKKKCVKPPIQVTRIFTLSPCVIDSPRPWWGLPCIWLSVMNDIKKDKQELHDKILNEIDDVEYRYYALPHSGLIADWFIHYWDLADLVMQYFDEPFYKPQKSTEDQIKQKHQCFLLVMSDSKKDKKKQKQAAYESDYRWRTGTLNKKERDAMKRYGLDLKDYKMGGGRFGEAEDYDTMREDFLRAASNDYDTRRGIEALAMSGKDKARDIAKNGFSDPGDVMNANNMQRKQHERMGNGGEFSSRSDFAGVSFGSVERDRSKLNESIDGRMSATQQAEDANKGFTYEGPDKEISPEMKEAKERAAAFESNSGQGSPSPYGARKSMFDDAASSVYGSGDDQQAETTMVADSAEAKDAGGYLNAFKNKMKEERNLRPDF